MVTFIQSHGNRFIALSTYNSEEEGTGTTNYDRIIAINAGLAGRFGSNYFDMRGWLIRNGFAVQRLPRQPRTPPILLMTSSRIRCYLMDSI
jgi:hypothetical protein